MEQRKLTALMLVFGLVLFFGGVTYAAKAAKAAKAMKVSGEVTAVDATAKTVTVKDKAGKEVILQIVDSTTIKLGKEAKKLEDIKSGGKVNATYHEVSGKMEAKAILLH